jgi:hypothetical protein
MGGSGANPTYGDYAAKGTRWPTKELVEVRQQQFPIVGNGEGVWSWLHIEDAAISTVAAAEQGNPGIYLIANDQPLAVREWHWPRTSAISIRVRPTFSCSRLKHVHFSGFTAWVLWVGIHIYFLIGFANRLLVTLQWAISFVTKRRGVRILPLPQRNDSCRSRPSDTSRLMPKTSIAEM